ncbi:MAG: hypoxanthine phosphoribosyltransferase [bacterium]
MRKLIGREEIHKRVQELGKEITSFYQERPFTCLIILKGSIVFAADLIRAITSENLVIDFVRLSSYRGTKSTGNVQMLLGELEKFRGKELLIVEDIVDTGSTLTFFLEKLKEVSPSSVKICSLLEKKEINRGKIKVDFLGFDIKDEFVIGYGLDLNEKFRNLPDIMVYEEKNE